MSIIDDLTGKTAADAARESAQLQSQGLQEGIVRTEAGKEEALGFLQPFQGLGTSGIEQAGFLTDPQAQFDFLQNNPLFAAALENANTQTQGLAAARGRLSAGDTLQKLSENVLLSASPLIQQQKSSIADLLNIGTGIAGGQASIASGTAPQVADLITSRAAAEGAGVVGAANARGAGASNLLTSAILAGSAFGGPAAAAPVPGDAFLPGALPSDARLKSNITKIGESKGFNIYSWTWNSLARKLGLSGKSFGVLAQEVQKTNPEAVVNDRGILKVYYSMIGVPHEVKEVS